MLQSKVIWNRLRNPRLILLDIFSSRIQRLSDKSFLKLKYFVIFGRFLNLKNPKSFNEKVQCLKLSQRNPLMTILVDKKEVKGYIDRLGIVNTIKTLHTWESAEKIDFELLPNRFVLKTTHDSGGVVVCKDKSELNIDQAKKVLEDSLNHNYYISGREWPYKNVVPRIIAEEYIEDETGELRDFKFFCFNGIVKFFKVDFNRSIDHHANYYDCDLHLLDIGECICPPVPSHEVIFPSNIHEMIAISEKLSKDFPFVRVDLYNVNSTVYFGELTFYPASGFGRFTDEKWDYIIGSYLKLPQ